MGTLAQVTHDCSSGHRAAIGCVIVMVMKGPAYVADGYPVSHRDRPRATPETAEEAAAVRPRQTLDAA